MVSTPIISRLVYPELPNRVTSADLQVLFTPSYDERKWAVALARTSAAQVALLSQLKVFQTIGRFLPVKAVSPATRITTTTT